MNFSRYSRFSSATPCPLHGRKPRSAHPPPLGRFLAAPKNLSVSLVRTRANTTAVVARKRSTADKQSHFTHLCLKESKIVKFVCNTQPSGPALCTEEKAHG